MSGILQSFEFMKKKPSFSISLYDTWDIYIKLCDLRYNIDKLVKTDEVKMKDKARLKEYSRTLRRRTNRLEAIMEAEKRIEPTKFIPQPRPEYVEVFEGC